jgi:dTDP-4-amino-4,6-dideoxygalactose transaminase
VKHICCGEGGAVLTNDEELAERIIHLRSHGIVRTNDPDGTKPWFYEQTDLGWNYRLTDIQSALGISQLARLDQFLERRRILASRYQNALSNAPFSDIFSLPLTNLGHAWHLRHSVSQKWSTGQGSPISQGTRDTNANPLHTHLSTPLLRKAFREGSLTWC